MDPVWHRIASFRDPHLPAVADLWQASFPPAEQIRLGEWVRWLVDLTDAPERCADRELVALLSPDDHSVVGLAYLQVLTADASTPVAVLWYLATRADLRGAGLGAAAYAQVRRRVFGDRRCAALVFEVERADLPLQSAAESALAARRIAWYQRLGARLLSGIGYRQCVGWQPPVPMHVMVDAPTALTPQRALALAQAALGELTVAGELRLTDAPPGPS